MEERQLFDNHYVVLSKKPVELVSGALSAATPVDPAAPRTDKFSTLPSKLPVSINSVDATSVASTIVDSIVASDNSSDFSSNEEAIMASSALILIGSDGISHEVQDALPLLSIHLDVSLPNPTVGISMEPVNASNRAFFEEPIDFSAAAHQVALPAPDQGELHSEPIAEDTSSESSPKQSFDDVEIKTSEGFAVVAAPLTVQPTISSSSSHSATSTAQPLSLQPILTARGKRAVISAALHLPLGKKTVFRYDEEGNPIDDHPAPATESSLQTASATPVIATNPSPSVQPQQPLSTAPSPSSTEIATLQASIDSLKTLMEEKFASLSASIDNRFAAAHLGLEAAKTYFDQALLLQHSPEFIAARASLKAGPSSAETAEYWQEEQLAKASFIKKIHEVQAATASTIQGEKQLRETLETQVQAADKTKALLKDQLAKVQEVGDQMKSKINDALNSLKKYSDEDFEDPASEGEKELSGDTAPIE